MNPFLPGAPTGFNLTCDKSIRISGGADCLGEVAEELLT